MKNQGVIVIFILGMTIILGYFVISPSSLLFLVGSPQALRAELSSIQEKIPTQAGKNVFLRQSNNLTQKVDPELIDLDSQIISCDSNINSLSSSQPTIGGSCLAGQTTLSSTKGLYLGGQCCGVLTDTKEYHEHLKILQKYKDIPDMVLNPYKTPINLAKKWIEYDNQTTLNEKDQKVFNQALKISHEGPCCCKCWHYYVNEGIAKKMIHDKGWNAQQVADFWDVSDICGT